MSRKASMFTAGASYIQLASIIMTGLLSMPLALRFLTDDQVGLWSFTLQSMGYFLLLDLGVTSSAGRLMGEAVHQADTNACSRWYSLFTLVLTAQGLIIFLAGYFSIDAVLNWFEIKPYLRPEARSLWLLMLGLNSLTFPLRVGAGIVFSQNRYYWVNLSSAIGVWAGLAAFYIFLKMGAGSMAYGYSSAITMASSCGVPWLAARHGPIRFRFSRANIQWSDLGQLFSYSSSIFMIGLAVQVVFFSQTLVVTKLLGLSAVTMLMFSSKAGTMLMQLLWRTTDALGPRWQQLYISDSGAHLAASFQRYTGLIMSCAIAGVTILIIGNQPFVALWFKPSLYAGLWFDVWLAVYVIQHTWNHSLAFCPVLAKQIRPLSFVSSADMVLNIFFSVLLVPKMGVSGVLAGGVLGSLISTLYLTARAPGYVSLTARAMVTPFLLRWLLMTAWAGCVIGWFYKANPSAQTFLLRSLLGCVTCGLFMLLHRHDLGEFMTRAKPHIPAPFRLWRALS
jgi:O-antigen/teichoic acid export membrane protein